MSSKTRLGQLETAATGELLGIDQAAAAMFGYESPEALLALGREGWLRLFPSAAAWAGRASSGEAAFELEAECTRADGSAWTARLMSGRPQAGSLSALVEDVSERKALERNARLLADIFDRLPNPVFVKDEAHRWLLLNDAYCRFMGLPREQLIGKTDYDFFPPAESAVFWAKDDFVFANGETNENEEQLTDPSGRRHVILTRKSLLVDDEGHRSLLGVITDITERNQIEAELRRSRDDLERRVAERTAELVEANHQLQFDIEERQRFELHLGESEARFRHLADSMPQMVWTSLPDGCIDYVNRKWSEYTRRPTSELVAAPHFATLMAREDLPAFEAKMTQALRTGTVFEAEYRLRRHDGVLRWHLARALPVRDASGTIVRWYGSATDIEDQKRHQQALEDEDRRKNDFLALLGHELRNPLTPVRNAVYLLKRREPAPELARPLQIIDRQVTHMARLIDDLLDLSRIARGKISLKPEMVDFAQIVRASVDDRCESAEARGLQLRDSIPQTPLPVHGDPIRLAQIVANLLENAEKFSDPAGTIEVRLEAAGESARLTVRDTGIGMSEETLRDLFVPFVQPRTTLERGRGGLGLGLALVKGLADLHGGRVEARSEGLGKGSEFVIELPLEDAGAAAELPAEALPARRRKVLIIEDNSDVAESLRMVLEVQGHEAAVAGTAEAGIELAHRFRPDVVLSDIGLPGRLSGHDVARTLRREAGVRPLLLVAVSGYGLEEDRRRALEAGFDRHLTKPIDVRELARLLAEEPVRRS